MSDLTCPYCGKEVEHDDEQFKPDVAHETECEHCEKSFIFYVEWYPHFSESRAPCLNGGEHKWIDKLVHNEYYRQYFKVWRRCEYCQREEREAAKGKE